jgi:hypothetical protein
MNHSELHDDYEDAAQRSYELGIAKEAEFKAAMTRALGDGELTLTGAANETRFYSEWGLVEGVLKEIEGLDIVHLTINGSRELPARYSWQGPDTWEVTVTHSRGCYSRYFYT